LHRWRCWAGKPRHRKPRHRLHLRQNRQRRTGALPRGSCRLLRPRPRAHHRRRRGHLGAAHPLLPVYLTTEYLIRRPFGACSPPPSAQTSPRCSTTSSPSAPITRSGSCPPRSSTSASTPAWASSSSERRRRHQGPQPQLNGSIWTSDWIAGALSERIPLRGTDSLHPAHLGKPAARSHLLRHRRQLLGVRSQPLRQGRDRRRRHVRRAPPPHHPPGGGMGIRADWLHHGHFGGIPASSSARPGRLPIPYGFDRGYTAEYNHLMLAFDNAGRARAWLRGAHRALGRSRQRLPRFPRLRVAALGRRRGRLLRHRRRGRVMSVNVTTSFADPLGSAHPLTELVSLGGSNPMRGFSRGACSAAAPRCHLALSLAHLDMARRLPPGRRGQRVRRAPEDFKPSLLRFSARLASEKRGFAPTARSSCW